MSQLLLFVDTSISSLHYIRQVSMCDILLDIPLLFKTLTLYACILYATVTMLSLCFCAIISIRL